MDYVLINTTENHVVCVTTDREFLVDAAAMLLLKRGHHFEIKEMSRRELGPVMYEIARDMRWRDTLVQRVRNQQVAMERHLAAQRKLKQSMIVIEEH